MSREKGRAEILTNRNNKSFGWTYDYMLNTSIAALALICSATLLYATCSGQLICSRINRFGTENSLVRPERENSAEAISNIGLRNGFTYPKGLCGYSEAHVQILLDKPHNCSRGNSRIILNGSWKTISEVSPMMNYPRTDGRDKVVCLVFCVEEESPCLNEKCLIPVNVRKNTTDITVAKLLLDDGEYDIIRPAMAFNTILDAGANCGIATIIFATMFPNATIVSLEASSVNYEILKKNAQRFKNVITVNAGLWTEVGDLAVYRGNLTPGANEEWQFMVEDRKKVPLDIEIVDEIQGVSVDFLVKVYNLKGFELVKMDIEGSEKEVLSMESNSSFSWIEESKLAILEVHDHMRAGAAATVEQAFSKFGNWEYVGRSGEYSVYKNKQWKYKFDI